MTGSKSFRGTTDQSFVSLFEIPVAPDPMWFFIQRSLYFFVTSCHSSLVSALHSQESVLPRFFYLPLN